MNNNAAPLLPDARARNTVLNDLDTCILVEAAAGTGKTTGMVGRMVALLAQGKCKISTLAAVTFTRKAAAELRERFRAALEDALRHASGPEQEALLDALFHIDRCFIGTIHSFCGRLLRERPVEADTDLGFEEMDEAEDLALRKRAWNEYVTRLYAAGAPIIGDLTAMGLALEDLAPSFETFAEYPDVDDWPLENPPGRPPDPAKVSAFLDQVFEHANDVRDGFPPHYSQWDHLMRLYDGVERMIRHVKTDSDPDRFFSALAAFRNPSSEDLNEEKWRGGKKRLKEEKAVWKEFQAKRDEFLDQWRRVRYPLCLRVLKECKETYDRLRRESGRLNYQDLLMKAARLLRDKPDVRRYFRERFTHILVDEFQDTDPIQAQVMMFLTADNDEQAQWDQCRPRPGALFVVGDPKQSIYRFRRADIVTYNKVKSIIDRTGGRVVSLQTNFRSSSGLIEWINKVFQKQFPVQANDCAPQYAPLVAPIAAAPKCSPAPPVRLLLTPKHIENHQAVEYDAQMIARSIRRALDEEAPTPRKSSPHGEPHTRPCVPGDFLVITRNTKNLGMYARTLRESGIPARVTGGDELNRTPALRLLSLCIGAALHPDDQPALVAVLRSGLFGISDASLYDFKKNGGRFNFFSPVPYALGSCDFDAFTDAFERLRKCHDMLRVAPAASAVESIAEDLGLTAIDPADPLGPAGPVSTLKAIELIRAAGAPAAAEGALNYLNALASGAESHDAFLAPDPQYSAVRVMNLHKAKGLEAPFVFLADPTGEGNHGVDLHIDRSGPEVTGYMVLRARGGAFPGPSLAVPPQWNARAKVEKDFHDAERIRLLYVAATRAGAQLTVSQREKPTNGYNPNTNNPWKMFEPFLDPNARVANAVASHCAASPAEPPQAAPDAVNYEELLERRRNAAIRPTFASGGIKELSVQVIGGFGAGRAKYAMEFGAAVHAVLERAASAEASFDLSLAAEMALAKEGVGVELRDEVVAAAESVLNCQLWKRASAAKRRLAEVPLQFLVETEAEDGARLPTIMRGVIDLLFEEENGWVIVDYKTDGIPQEGLTPLVNLYAPQVSAYCGAWTKLTGQHVSEAGLLFTSVSEYVRVPSTNAGSKEILLVAEE